MDPWSLDLHTIRHSPRDSTKLPQAGNCLNVSRDSGRRCLTFELQRGTALSLANRVRIKKEPCSSLVRGSE